MMKHIVQMIEDWLHYITANSYEQNNFVYPHVFIINYSIEKEKNFTTRILIKRKQKIFYK